MKNNFPYDLIIFILGLNNNVRFFNTYPCLLYEYLIAFFGKNDGKRMS